MSSNSYQPPRSASPARGSPRGDRSNGGHPGPRQDQRGRANGSNGRESNVRQGNGGFSSWGAGFPTEGDWKDGDPGQEAMEGWEGWEEENDDAAADYYALLNVPRDATPNQIRSSYHNLSLRFHPDKQPAHRRERTTAHFNNILVAYETLMNPHKRTIYDTLGVEGLKQKAFDVGVKTMDPEEFKIWLQEQVRKHKVAEVMSLVNSRGEIKVELDVSGLQFQEAVEVIGPDGVKRLQFMEMKPVKLTKYVIKHSFTAPLESLGKLLSTPLPNFKKLTGKEEPPKKPKIQAQAFPALTLTAFLGGAPVQTSTGLHTYLASPGLSAQINHSFPPVHPEAPLSVSSILAGLDFEATTTVLPQRVFATSVSKSFGSSRLILKPIFNTSPHLAPPIIEATYAASVGKRGDFFIQYNSGVAQQWPSALSFLSSPPQTSYLTIGYTVMPTVGAPTLGDNDGDDSEVPRFLHTKKQSRSKATETWRVTATAGVLAGGAQFGLSWGRTYFIGTPIGSPSLNPTLGAARSKAKAEGIRINVDTTFGLMSGVLFNVKAGRKIFTNTRMGVGLGIGGAGRSGVVLSVNWSRLGQKISVPVAIAPIPEATSIMYGVLVPFVGYAVLEGLYLRPRQHRLRKKEIEKTKRQLIVKVAKNKKKAEEIVQLMRGTVETSQRRREEEGGLVIIEAGYGVKGKAGEWTDVTIALAALIDGDQLVIPRGVNKSHITGFYDPAPGEKKELWVRYLFKGKKHEISVENSRGLVIPMRAHCIE